MRLQVQKLHTVALSELAIEVSSLQFRHPIQLCLCHTIYLITISSELEYKIRTTVRRQYLRHKNSSIRSDSQNTSHMARMFVDPQEFFHFIWNLIFQSSWFAVTWANCVFLEVLKRIDCNFKNFHLIDLNRILHSCTIRH